MTKHYAITVAWKVFNDHCHHFSKGMLMSIFDKGGEVRRPTIALYCLANKMMGGEDHSEACWSSRSESHGWTEAVGQRATNGAQQGKTSRQEPNEKTRQAMGDANAKKDREGGTGPSAQVWKITRFTRSWPVCYFP